MGSDRFELVPPHQPVGDVRARLPGGVPRPCRCRSPSRCSCPLVANGYLKREDTIPYIAGANITTLADTLVAAVILGNPDAVRVVLAEVIGVSTFTVLLLAVAYPLVRRGSIAWARFVLTQPQPPGRLRAWCSLAIPIALIAY